MDVLYIYKLAVCESRNTMIWLAIIYAYKGVLLVSIYWHRYQQYAHFFTVVPITVSSIYGSITKYSRVKRTKKQTKKKS